MKDTKKGFNVKNLSSDTIKFKELSRDYDRYMKLELIKVEEDTNLFPELDTLILSDLRMACDCPDWFDETRYILKYPHQTCIYNEMDNNGKLDFRYYVQPACKELSMDKLSFVPGTKVKFIGRHYKKHGLPGDTQDPNPPKWKVFRYYSFEVVRPYKVYFTIPSFESTSEDIKDSMTYLTID